MIKQRFEINVKHIERRRRCDVFVHSNAHVDIYGAKQQQQRNILVCCVCVLESEPEVLKILFCQCNQASAILWAAKYGWFSIDCDTLF